MILGVVMNPKTQKYVIESIQNWDCEENIKDFLINAFEFELYNVDKKPKKILEYYDKFIDTYIE